MTNTSGSVLMRPRAIRHQHADIHLRKSQWKAYTEFICNPAECELITTIPENLVRTSPYLSHKVFNSYHSEQR